MVVCKFGYTSTSGGSGKEADLHKIGLVYVFDSHCFLTDSCSESVKSDRTAAVVFDDCFKKPSVDVVKTELVYFQCFKCVFSDIRGNRSVALNECKITNSFKQSVGNTGRTSGARCYAVSAVVGNLDFKNACRTLYDSGKLLGGLKLKL